MDLLDRVTGMLEGVALGDALGAPHEFHYNHSLVYTGLLQHHNRVKQRFKGYRYDPIGQVTDDFEMTCALATSLAQQQGYDRNAVILAYEAWTATKPPLGYNTRALFGGVTTIQGYEQRARKVFATESSQSNGSLMRSSPLAIFRVDSPNQTDNYLSELPWYTDCELTNPNPVNRLCSYLYLTAIRRWLQEPETPGLTLFYQLAQLATDSSLQRCPEVEMVFHQLEQGEARDLTVNKGWVAHGFYAAMATLAHLGTALPTPSSVYDWLILQGGDTDTNAAIAGGLLGARLGASGLRSDPTCANNLDILLAAQVSRPPVYHPRQIAILAPHLVALFQAD